MYIKDKLCLSGDDFTHKHLMPRRVIINRSESITRVMLEFLRMAVILGLRVVFVKELYLCFDRGLF